MTITFAVAVLIMFLVRGQTTVAVPFYGVGVFMPITAMGLAVRRHVLTHYQGKVRRLGAAAATFVTILAGLVFLGQLIGKWEEGGWIALLGFSVLTVVAHVMLLSPFGYREAGQVNRIVHDKARVQGAMASIVKWQAFKMQEYRYRLMIGIAGFLELFGIGQQQRSLALAGAEGGRMQLTRSARVGTELRQRITPAADGTQSEVRSEVPETNGLAGLHLPPHILRHRIIVPVNGLHQGTMTALRYAQSLSPDVTAVHVSMDAAQAESLGQQWTTWGEGIRLVILESPHNMVLEPLLEYIQGMIRLRQTNEIITVVVPQSVRPRWWTNLMRTQIGVLLRLSLPFETGIVITDVPYVLDGDEE